MPKPSALSYRLWTPVANAFEAYRRRLLADPRAIYEHIWRLIHIEESLVVTLGSALACRLLLAWKDEPEKLDELNLLRRMISGLRGVGDEGEESEIEAGACLLGSIGAWTDLLNQFGTPTVEPGCPFCNSVASFLNEELPEAVAFVDPWQRIGPVPETFRETRSRIGRLKAINSFRNKLAHVPISEKILQDLHEGLRKEVLLLLTPDATVLGAEAQTDPKTTQWHITLAGRIVSGKSFVTGSDFGDLASDEAAQGDGIWFDWRASSKEELRWSASPFVQLDAELKVLLLFRVSELSELEDAPESSELQNAPDETSLTGEYYRFAAEIEPVQELQVDTKHLRPWIPQKLTAPPVSPTEGAPISTVPSEKVAPVDTEAGTLQSEMREKLPPPDPASMTPLELRTRAEDAYRNRHYSLATTLLDELARRGEPELYNHVTKLRHGETMWKAAERHIVDYDEKISRIDKAIALLRDAAGHRDVKYAARARYQLSKALWHLWRYKQKSEILENARKEAKDAAELAYEPQYISWYERIRQEGSPGAAVNA
jgi:hypothetical protein